MDDKEDDMLETYYSSEYSATAQYIGGTRCGRSCFAAQMAREAFGTNWLKLEIHPDPRYLLPDSIETLKATEQLVKLGFIVLPYCQADPRTLQTVGRSRRSYCNAAWCPHRYQQSDCRLKEFLQIIIEQAGIPVMVDAGIGAPSHAAEAMELGASAALVNTAIAVAGNPVEMALAFKGYRGRKAGIRSRSGHAGRQLCCRSEFAFNRILNE